MLQTLDLFKKKVHILLIQKVGKNITKICTSKICHVECFLMLDGKGPFFEKKNLHIDGNWVFTKKCSVLCR